MLTLPLVKFCSHWEFPEGFCSRAVTQDTEAGEEQKLLQVSSASLHQQHSYQFDLIFQVYYRADVAVGFVAALEYTVGFGPSCL